MNYETVPRDLKILQVVVDLNQCERKGSVNELFLHCRNCDSLAVVAVGHVHPHLAGRYREICRLFMSFVALACNKHSPKQSSV